MTTRLSRLYGMDIYSDAGKYLGKVIDLILDLEKGEVVRLTMQPLTTVSRDEARKVLREASVLYRNVKSVEDVVVVTKGTAAEKFAELPEEEVRGFGR
ncbi:MAG: PRC-barrel domain-containing protein [Candidatus Micrarchaeota archaeon]|nr:PRC-barrel domain-containing protein [Candidatus Micrarchaeota archaeon]